MIVFVMSVVVGRSLVDLSSGSEFIDFKEANTRPLSRPAFTKNPLPTVEVLEHFLFGTLHIVFWWCLVGWRIVFLVLFQLHIPCVLPSSFLEVQDAWSIVKLPTSFFLGNLL